MLICWLTLVLLAATWRAVEPCSCMPAHVQTQYCNSDFVIIARVLEKQNVSEFQSIYSLNIRRVFKQTPKALVALKSSRVHSAASESVCGVALQPRETYVITGSVYQLRAHISLCGFVSKWRDVNPRMRKGFRQLFKKGCTCKIRLGGAPSPSRNTCFAHYGDCYDQHGVCLHDSTSRCRWRKSRFLTRCLQPHLFRNETQLLPPRM